MNKVLEKLKAIENSPLNFLACRLFCVGIVCCLIALSIQYLYNDNDFSSDTGMHLFVIVVVTWAYFLIIMFLNRRMFTGRKFWIKWPLIFLLSFLVSHIFALGTALISKFIFHNNIDTYYYVPFVLYWHAIGFFYLREFLHRGLSLLRYILGY